MGSAAESFVVGPDAGDLRGADNLALQRAVDLVAERGGGTVRILPGTYTMDDSLHLRSGVRLVGSGELTVLFKAPCVETAVAAYLGYGHTDISVAEPEKLRVGMGVAISDDLSPGFYTTVATLTWRDGDLFGLSQPLEHDCSPERHGRVSTLFPVLSACGVEDAAIEDLTVAGNAAQNERLSGCRGGGIYLLQSRRVALRNLRIADFHGDGVSFQQCTDLLLEDLACEANTGSGLHPGSGSTRFVIRRCRLRANGTDGIYYCLRVTYSLCEDCLIEQNGACGISIGGRDTDHLLRGNRIVGNKKHGVVFRSGDIVMAPHRNVLQANVISGNAGNGILVDGEVRQVFLLDNEISGTEPAAALFVRNGNARLVARGNRLSGTRVFGRGVPPEAIGEVGEPPPVGPAAAPPNADRHLRVWPARGG